MPELKKRIIIGGGIAGVAAAYWCRRQDPQQPVVLYEKESLLLPWIGRGGKTGLLLGCLADHERAEAGDFARGGPHAAAIVAKWPGQATRDWLASIGVSMQRDDSGRLLAADSGQLREALISALTSVGVEVKPEFSLETISRQPDGSFRIWSRDGIADAAQRLLLATGGARNHGLALAREFGVEENPSIPAFVRLKAANPKLGERLGPLSRDIRLRCARSGLEATGSATFSSRGLEGDALSRLSCQLCEDWKQRGYRISLEIDWVPDLSTSSLRSELISRTHTGKRKQVGEEAIFGFNQRQWLVFLDSSRIDPETPWIRLKARKLQMLVQRLKAHRVAFAGMGLPSGERVWAGGVCSSEVDWSTGEARRVSGLYFAGEILDLLGLPGGSHLNLVWAGGYLSGSAMALADAGAQSP